MRFSGEYGQIRTLRAAAVREGSGVTEDVVQCIWYDQLFTQDGLQTEDGRSLRVVSPGWWNRGEGPDFRGAQVEIAGRLKNGDVEIHLKSSGWNEHSHQLDSRYDNVILHVILDGDGKAEIPVTSSGTAIPTFVLKPHLEEDVQTLAERFDLDDYPYQVSRTFGQCSALVEAYGSEHLTQLLTLAGQWRMLYKARLLRERMDRVGPNQAIYEDFLAACGFSRFKDHFRAIARQLPYDRAAQLAQQDPMGLEAAFLHMGGLLPDALPDGTSAMPHFARLRALRLDTLSGLRKLPLEWQRAGVRPVNNPERRLAGAARFIARCAAKGLEDTLYEIWLEDHGPVTRRRAFEALFPKAMGFWASHCTWTGKQLKSPTAPLGSARVRSIVGNVFIPAGLARARADRNRRLEEKVVAFFEALPKEADNHILKIMLPRIYGENKGPRLTFCLQQGLLQMYHDWCEPNPSCRNCPVVANLDVEAKLAK